ncbi:hypothetical protein ACLFKT_46860, partial [Paraburkholderia sp. BR14261]
VTVAALQEAGASADVVKAVGAAKKTEAAERAEAQLRDSGWLPAPLRGLHYAMNTAARAKRSAKEAPAAKKRASTKQPATAKQGLPKKRAAVRVVAKAAAVGNAKPTSKRKPQATEAWPFPNTGRP